MTKGYDTPSTRQEDQENINKVMAELFDKINAKAEAILLLISVQEYGKALSDELMKIARVRSKKFSSENPDIDFDLITVASAQTFLEIGTCLLGRQISVLSPENRQAALRETFRDFKKALNGHMKDFAAHDRPLSERTDHDAS